FNDDNFIQDTTEIEYVKNKIMIQPLTEKKQLKILHNTLRIVDEKIDN
ncbi:18663_t:CDS:1, partial [Racocetra persica]